MGTTMHAALASALALLAVAPSSAAVVRPSGLAGHAIPSLRRPRAALLMEATSTSAAVLRERASTALRGVAFDALGPLELLPGVESLDVVALGLVDPDELAVSDDGSVSLELRSRTPAQPAVVALARACEDALMRELDVPSARVTPTLAPTPKDSGQDSAGLKEVAHVVAVGSCKGGVGKSTCAVNLAFALAQLGARVGIVDVDIYGPSLPTMVQPASAQVQVIGSAILPLEAHGVAAMSIGWVNPNAMLLRGAKIAPLVEQLVGQTAWGPLDYLVVDMPPGTGDIQLALSQSIRVAGCVLVTTPQRLSFVDVVKGVEMLDKVGIPTLAVLENMASYSPPRVPAERVAAFCEKHGLGAEARAELEAELIEPAAQPLRLFGGGHVERLREMWGIAASYSLPLLPEVAHASDAGLPHVVAHPESEAASVFRQLAGSVALEVMKQTLAPADRPMVVYDEGAREVVATIGGVRYALSPLELRRRCRSPTNDPDACPDDVHPLDIVPMGNYAVSVNWSDGHQSLFPYATFTGHF